ncbi:hypothetical protein F383_32415 [Gossypium arboreum]|uniref:Uncharacterized protein n=1 Tax=Gossypium arboreum TaxID=29729 RepID=A0A0B0PM08_GOSAR|nr:hypothetical protein F383_32415 [Gossypium arboreum]
MHYYPNMHKLNIQGYTLEYKSGSINLYSCAYISISKSTFSRTSPLQRDYQSRLNSDPGSDYPSGLNPFYTYSSGGLYQDRITHPG